MENGTICLCPWLRLDGNKNLIAMGYERVRFLGEENCDTRAVRYFYVGVESFIAPNGDVQTSRFYTLEPLDAEE